MLLKAFKRGVAIIGVGLSTVRVAPPLVMPREMALKAASVMLEILRGYR